MECDTARAGERTIFLTKVGPQHENRSAAFEHAHRSPRDDLVAAVPRTVVNIAAIWNAAAAVQWRLLMQWPCLNVRCVELAGMDLQRVVGQRAVISLLAPCSRRCAPSLTPGSCGLPMVSVVCTRLRALRTRSPWGKASEGGVGCCHRLRCLWTYIVPRTMRFDSSTAVYAAHILWKLTERRV